MRVMSFTPQNDVGPLPGDRISQLEYWCEVVGWMCREFADDYAAGDLRTRWAMYHTVGLVADIARHLDDDIRSAMTGVTPDDWKGLAEVRVFVVHRPGRVDHNIVWATATGDIPVLLAELRRVAGRTA